MTKRTANEGTLEMQYIKATGVLLSMNANGGNFMTQDQRTCYN